MCCVGAVAASQLDFADLSIFARSFAVLSDGPKIGGVTNVRSKSRGGGQSVIQGLLIFCF